MKSSGAWTQVHVFDSFIRYNRKEMTSFQSPIKLKLSLFRVSKGLPPRIATEIINLIEDSVGERGRALLVRRVEVVPRADVVLLQSDTSGRSQGFVDNKIDIAF